MSKTARQSSADEANKRIELIREVTNLYIKINSETSADGRALLSERLSRMNTDSLNAMLIDMTERLNKKRKAERERNLYCYGGVVFSQKVLLKLVDKGMSREDAYRVVQSAAHAAWNQPGGDFRALVEQSTEIQAQLSPEEIADCFDTKHHLKNLDTIFQRLGI